MSLADSIVPTVLSMLHGFELKILELDIAEGSQVDPVGLAGDLEREFASHGLRRVRIRMHSVIPHISCGSCHHSFSIRGVKAGTSVCPKCGSADSASSTPQIRIRRIEAWPGHR